MPVRIWLKDYLGVEEGVHVLDDELRGGRGDVAVRQERDVLLRILLLEVWNKQKYRLKTFRSISWFFEAKKSCFSTISSQFKKQGCRLCLPEVLDYSERLLYLTRCHSWLRPWWMGRSHEKFIFDFFLNPSETKEAKNSVQKAIVIRKTEIKQSID